MRLYLLRFHILLFACFVLSVSLQRIAESDYRSVSHADSQYYLPPASWLKVFSIGYNEAFADAIWTKFIIYFGSAPKQNVKPGMFLGDDASANAAKQGVENYTLNYVQAVTDLDSRFLAAYAHGARLTMYHKGIISKQTVQVAIKILEKGIRFFPDDGALRFNLGFLYYYELIPFIRDAEEKKKIKEKGANILYTAAKLPGAPPYVAELASSLLSRHKMNNLAIEHIRFMLLAETDPDIRRHLQKELEDLVGKQIQFEEQQMANFSELWRTRYAFIPFDLYTVLYDSLSDSTISINGELY